MEWHSLAVARARTVARVKMTAWPLRRRPAPGVGEVDDSRPAAKATCGYCDATARSFIWVLSPAEELTGNPRAHSISRTSHLLSLCSEYRRFCSKRGWIAALGRRTNNRAGRQIEDETEHFGRGLPVQAARALSPRVFEGSLQNPWRLLHTDGSVLWTWQMLTLR